jgi:ribosomal protein S18 acetylase RimI-like enzyme
MDEIVDTFQDAFSSYAVPVHMTVAKLEMMMRTRSVRLDRSFGLFDGDRLVGFVLNGSRVCDGVLTAYDSGTGIRTDYQNHGHGAAILMHTTAELQRMGYRRYLLEVLTDNAPAVSLYQRHGFSILRELDCYRMERSAVQKSDHDATDSDVAPDWSCELSHIRTYRPTWQNNVDSVRAIADSCRLLKAKRGGRTAAYGILEPNFGALMQIGWTDQESANAIIGRAAAVTTSDELKVINVPTTSTETGRMLIACGFRCFVSQYEMGADLE